MQLGTNEKLWNSILKMPSTRWMLKAALKECPKCGRTRLETASDDYVGRGDAKCLSCSLCSFAIRFWIEFLRKNFKVKEERARRIVGDQYSKRAMKSIIRGFLDFGLDGPL